MSNPSVLVQKLWNCNPAVARRDDGLSYGNYVEQLILPQRDCYLKMADEQTRPPFYKPSPLAEQTRIVAELERRLSVVEGLEAVVSANLQRATRLRQSILQKAFTGELF